MSTVSHLENLTTKIHQDVYPFIDPSTTLRTSMSNKTILITGGGRGIGQAVAESFALASASTIILTGRTESTLASTASSLRQINPALTVQTHTTDISSSSSVAALFAAIGCSPDVVVHNAGRINARKALAESAVDDWWSAWETNVKGTFLIAREYCLLLEREQRSGVLINTSSTSAFRTDQNMSAYQAGKAAVNRITECLDAEYRDKGLKCVSYSPGSVKTDMMLEAFGDVDPALWENFEFDSPRLPGATCVYLATERSDFLRGRFVSSHWDMEELEARREEIESGDFGTMKIVGW